MCLFFLIDKNEFTYVGYQTLFEMFGLALF